MKIMQSTYKTEILFLVQHNMEHTFNEEHVQYAINIRKIINEELRFLAFANAVHECSTNELDKQKAFGEVLTHISKLTTFEEAAHAENYDQFYEDVKAALAGKHNELMEPVRHRILALKYAD